MKDIFDESFVSVLAQRLERAYPKFRRTPFVANARQGLSNMALKARVQHLADVVRAHLPSGWHAASKCLVHDLPEPRDPDGPGAFDMRFWVHTAVVSRHGLHDPNRSLDLLHALTQRYTAEFDVRAFLRADPESTLHTFSQWMNDVSPHVRRLTSEGSRPRLPWGERLDLWEDHQPAVLKILTGLRDDPTSYVRRSVANHLNDLSKDEPDAIVAICADWLGDDAPATRPSLVRHALRTLIKRGHPDALAVLGYAHDAPVDIVLETLPANITLGETVYLVATVTNPTAIAIPVVVDVVVHFVRADGSRSPKVFKMGVAELPPSGSKSLRLALPFKPVTTRAHYAGEHRLELQVNGTIRHGVDIVLRLP